MKKLVLIILSTIFVLFTYNGLSQNNSEFPDTNYRKNVIKWNMTTFILFSTKNINISYERVLKPHRTFSINAGYFEMPFDGLFDSLFVNRSNEKSGFSVSGDYRFYFKERNKNWAPDGLYWAIYSSYHHFQFKNTIQLINRPDIQGDVEFGGVFNILSAGVELGYQFAIKERLTIDLIFMGPSISAYNRTLTLGGSVNNENEYLEAILDAIKNKYPYFQELTESGEIVNNKAKTHMGFGLRYLIQIGYRF
ncbi:MAG: hypothetical protein DRI95_10870 [Bacteroidetes bacterium]|nr:MAG: hypothetical protein DRI95_10870 [Bacteroidota bacterium]